MMNEKKSNKSSYLIKAVVAGSIAMAGVTAPGAIENLGQSSHNMIVHAAEVAEPAPDTVTVDATDTDHIPIQWSNVESLEGNDILSVVDGIVLEEEEIDPSGTDYNIEVSGTLNLASQGGSVVEFVITDPEDDDNIVAEFSKTFNVTNTDPVMNFTEAVNDIDDPEDTNRASGQVDVEYNDIVDEDYDWTQFVDTNSVNDNESDLSIEDVEIDFDAFDAANTEETQTVTYRLVDEAGAQYWLDLDVDINYTPSIQFTDAVEGSGDNRTHTISFGDDLNPYDLIVDSNENAPADVGDLVQVDLGEINFDLVNKSQTLAYTVRDTNGDTVTTYNLGLTINNEAPVLEFAEGVETNDDDQVVLDWGDQRSVTDFITANDSEEGDLTENIEVDGELNSREAGTYNVTYSIADSADGTDELSVEFVVNERPNEAPILIANDRYVLQGSDFDILQNVKAIDFEDGEVSDLTDRVEIADDGDFDIDTPGEYTITLSVEDYDGAVTEETITIAVGENNEAADDSEREDLQNQIEELQAAIAETDENAEALEARVAELEEQMAALNDNGSDDNGSDDNGSDDNGSDGNGSDDNDKSNDNGSDDNESDGNDESNDNGSADNGSDDNESNGNDESNDNGSDDNGSDDNGSDDNGSDDNGSNGNDDSNGNDSNGNDSNGNDSNGNDSNGNDESNGDDSDVNISGNDKSNDNGSDDNISGNNDSNGNDDSNDDNTSNTSGTTPPSSNGNTSTPSNDTNPSSTPNTSGDSSTSSTPNTSSDPSTPSASNTPYNPSTTPNTSDLSDTSDEFDNTSTTPDYDTFAEEDEDLGETQEVAALDTNDTDELPSTGNNVNIPLIALGSFLVLGSGGFLVYRKLFSQ